MCKIGGEGPAEGDDPSTGLPANNSLARTQGHCRKGRSLRPREPLGSAHRSTAVLADTEINTTPGLFGFGMPYHPKRLTVGGGCRGVGNRGVRVERRVIAKALIVAVRLPSQTPFGVSISAYQATYSCPLPAATLIRFSGHPSSCHRPLPTRTGASLEVKLADTR